jgi:hypothetical protein
LSTTFKNQADADLGAVFFDEDEFALPIAYNGTDILAIESDLWSQDSGIPGVSVPSRGLYIRQSDVSFPKPGDAVTIGAHTWHVGAGASLDGGLWQITLHRETLNIS